MSPENFVFSTLIFILSSALTRTSPIPNIPMTTTMKSMPSISSRLSHGEPIHPAHGVHAHNAEEKTQDDAHDGLHDRFSPEKYDGREPQQHEGEILRRTEFKGEFCQGGGHEHQRDDAQGPADERRDAADMARATPARPFRAI